MAVVAECRDDMATTATTATNDSLRFIFIHAIFRFRCCLFSFVAWICVFVNVFISVSDWYHWAIARRHRHTHTHTQIYSNQSFMFSFLIWQAVMGWNGDMMVCMANNFISYARIFRCLSAERCVCVVVFGFYCHLNSHAMWKYKNVFDIRFHIPSLSLPVPLSILLFFCLCFLSFWFSWMQIDAYITNEIIRIHIRSVCVCVCMCRWYNSKHPNHHHHWTK